MYNKLDEMLRHAKGCAKIGCTHGAVQWMQDAVGYGASIGTPVSPALQKGIEAKARRNERHMESVYASIDNEFLGR